jgi:hypothetical protein
MCHIRGNLYDTYLPTRLLITSPVTVLERTKYVIIKVCNSESDYLL